MKTTQVISARVLKSEGVLLVKTSLSEKPPSEMDVYLFNDLVVFAKKKDRVTLGMPTIFTGKTHKFKGQFPLDTSRVVLCADDEGSCWTLNI
jgi:hypothetical protein